MITIPRIVLPDPQTIDISKNVSVLDRFGKVINIGQSGGGKGRKLFNRIKRLAGACYTVKQNNKAYFIYPALHKVIDARGIRYKYCHRRNKYVLNTNFA